MMRGAITIGAALSIVAAESFGAGLAAESNYQLHCMGCHGAAGKSDPTRVPSINKTFVELAATAEGRNYLERVPGVANAPLNDEDLTALLNWLFNSLAKNAAASTFAVAEVASARRHPLTNVAGARQRVEAGRWPEAANQ